MKSTVLIFFLGFAFGVICIVVGSNNFHYTHGYATNTSYRTEYGSNNRSNSSNTNLGLSTRINKTTSGFANNNNTNPTLSYGTRVYPASKSYNNNNVWPGNIKQRRVKRLPPLNEESGVNINVDYEEEETSAQDDNPILNAEPLRQSIPSENPYTYGTLASKQSGAHVQSHIHRQIGAKSPTGAAFPSAVYGQPDHAQQVSTDAYMQPGFLAQPSLYGFNGPYFNSGQLSNLRPPQAYTAIPFATQVQPGVNMQLNGYPNAYEQPQPYLAYGPAATPIQFGFYGQLQATFAYRPFITLAQPPGAIVPFNTYPGIYEQPVYPYQLGNNFLNTPPFLMSQASYPELGNLKQQPLSANYQSDKFIKAPVQPIYQNTAAYYQSVQPPEPSGIPEEPISLGAKWQQHAQAAFAYQESGPSSEQSDSMEQGANSEFTENDGKPSLSASDQPDDCDDEPVRLVHTTSEVELPKEV